jgi:cytochrome c553
MIGKRLSVMSLYLLAMATAVMAEEVVSLSKDVMPLFAKSCTGCHQREGGNRKAIDQGPYLETESDILRIVGSLIIPGRPERSYLLMTMSKPKAGQPRVKMMPPERSKTPGMTDQEVQKISDWIKAGAKDN